MNNAARPSGQSPDGRGWTRRVRTMTNADEAAFAWALEAETAHLFTKAQRAWICVIIGAGDYTEAIEHLLRTVDAHDLKLSKGLVDNAVDWLRGFSGTVAESSLRRVVENVTTLNTAT